MRVSTYLLDYFFINCIISRCVNASYVTPGSSSKLWDDLGSSIYIKSAARSILRDSGSDGVNVQSFYFLTASKPVFSPMLLSSRFITPLTVVETDQGRRRDKKNAYIYSQFED